MTTAAGNLGNIRVNLAQAFANVGQVLAWQLPRDLTVISPETGESTASTLPRPGRTANWQLNVVKRLQSQLARGAYAQLGALRRCISWITTLPTALPEPVVAFADDGSVHIEWDNGEISLYVTFHNCGDEAYFCSSDDEWETSEIIGSSKINRAIASIAASSGASR